MNDDQFAQIYNNVKSRPQSGANEENYMQLAHTEYRATYDAPFTLVECWKVVKDSPKWKQAEMPCFFKTKATGSKKSRTSDNTSQETGSSAHFGLDLNEEGDSEDIDVQEVRPMGRDKAKKKAAASASHSQGSASAAVDPALYETLLKKWSDVAAPLFTQKHEANASFLKIKEQELELERLRLAQQREIESERLEHEKQQLQFQREQMEWQKQDKMEKDIMYYTTSHEHLTGTALERCLALKQKIKERHNLDY